MICFMGEKSLVDHLLCVGLRTADEVSIDSIVEIADIRLPFSSEGPGGSSSSLFYVLGRSEDKGPRGYEVFVVREFQYKKDGSSRGLVKRAYSDEIKDYTSLKSNT